VEGSLSLNIKNPETNKLVHDLADLTGENMSTAVTIAVRERLERIRKERNRETFIAEAMEIARDCARRMGKPGRALDVDELLYDERGLPK
jgi:antitoxin VapB